MLMAVSIACVLSWHSCCTTVQASWAVQQQVACRTGRLQRNVFICYRHLAVVQLHTVSVDFLQDNNSLLPTAGSCSGSRWQACQHWLATSQIDGQQRYLLYVLPKDCTILQQLAGVCGDSAIACLAVAIICLCCDPAASTQGMVCPWMRGVVLIAGGIIPLMLCAADIVAALGSATAVTSND